MFTGIVEELGRVRASEGGRLVVESEVISSSLDTGASVAVNGCCLTCVEAARGWWAADVVPETLARTTLGSLRPGDPVNLERPVRASDRLGGHIVQGHVDGVGTVLAPAPELVVEAPRHLVRYVVEKGSVAVDGCSLTVAGVEDASFSVAVIPHTAEVTTLGRRARLDQVNLEVDLLAKYVERLLQEGGVLARRGGPVA